MANIINWHLNNKHGIPVTEHVVYRSVNKDTVYQSENIIATVGSDISSYADTTALANVAYYYGVVVNFAGGSLRSKIRCISYIPDVGPGGSGILAGDYAAGTMGTYVLGIYSEVNEYFKQLLITRGNTVAANSLLKPAASYDYKVVFDGNVCYIPNNPILKLSNGNTAYAEGAVAIADHIRNNVIKWTIAGRDYRLKVADIEFTKAFYGVGKYNTAPYKPDEATLITYINNTSSSTTIMLYHPGMDGNSALKRTELNFGPANIIYNRYESALPTSSELGNTLYKELQCVVYFELMS